MRERERERGGGLQWMLYHYSNFLSFSWRERERERERERGGILAPIRHPYNETQTDQVKNGKGADDCSQVDLQEMEDHQ